MKTDATRLAYLEAAAAWLGRRRGARQRTDGASEVVYQGFLGPFLGFEGERGTLSSFICHLPFLIGELRVTTIILLPILQRGVVRKKGRSGSPFAVRDHRSLDEEVVDFSVPAGADDAWYALARECRRVGVRLGMIVPLATLAMDAPAIRRAPDLVYWWAADPDELLSGEPAPGSGGAIDGGKPGAWETEAVPAARALHRFRAAPAPEAVETMKHRDGVLLAATDEAGCRISVANAYPDPIAADSHTYTWRDVAAVRHFDEVAPRPYRGPARSGPNPIARQFLSDVVRHRLECDGGALLADVSSAIPDAVLADGVARYPENMLVAEQLWSFHDRPPFDFVTGPMIPCVAAHARAPALLAESLAYHLTLLGKTDGAAWFFAGVGNHDTVPCPSRWVRPLLLLFCLLPRSVPYLYSGTEQGCQLATNEEFGDLGGLPHTPEDDLLLFSQRPVPVPSTAELTCFVRFWCDLLRLRTALAVADMRPSSLGVARREGLLVSVELDGMLAAVNCDPSRAAVIGIDPDEWDEGLTVVSNSSFALTAEALTIEPLATAIVMDCGRLEEIGDSLFATRLDRDGTVGAAMPA